MKSSRTVCTSVAVFLFLLAASLRIPAASAQAQSESAQESVLELQITANDEISSANVSAHHLHLRPLHTAASGRALSQDSELLKQAPAEASSSEPSNFSVPSVPGIAAPGFYPADLSYAGGRYLPYTQSNNVYVNCAASCWGNPSTFLTNLDASNFIHVTDEYVHNTAGGRYTIGAASSISTPAKATLTPTDILSYVHSAAKAHGSGYGHVYHVFLRQGVNVCVQAGVCYSPNNANTFVFCAYHASVDFSDIGHVLYTVDPYQNVQGCAVPQPSPNGALVDSTSSSLSHEFIETITDPDGTAWYAQKSLNEYLQEIGDVCVSPFGKYGAVNINGKLYAIQPEYANKFHGCATSF